MTGLPAWSNKTIVQVLCFTMLFEMNDSAVLFTQKRLLQRQMMTSHDSVVLSGSRLGRSRHVVATLCFPPLQFHRGFKYLNHPDLLSFSFSAPLSIDLIWFNLTLADFIRCSRSERQCTPSLCDHLNVPHFRGIEKANEWAPRKACHICRPKHFHRDCHIIPGVIHVLISPLSFRHAVGR